MTLRLFGAVQKEKKSKEESILTENRASNDNGTSRRSQKFHVDDVTEAASN